jgi:hypothetical protein
MRGDLATEATESTEEERIRESLPDLSVSSVISVAKSSLSYNCHTKMIEGALFLIDLSVRPGV